MSDSSACDESRVTMVCPSCGSRYLSSPIPHLIITPDSAQVLVMENKRLRDQNASLKAENERVGQANDELVQENLRLRQIIEDATRTAAEMQEIFDHWVKTGEAK